MTTATIRRVGVWLAALAVLLPASACSRSGQYATVPVSGSVTCGGQPVAVGMIFFEPDTAAGNSGPQGIAEFSNGQYQTNPGFGAVPGVNRVRMEVTVLPPGAEMPKSDEPTPKGTITGVYETTVTVPEQGPAKIDFAFKPEEIKR